MVAMIVLTVLVAPLVVLTARIGRRRWVRRCGAAGLGAEAPLFHHRLTRT